DGRREIVAGPSVLDANGQPLWAWALGGFHRSTGLWDIQLSVRGGPFVTQFQSDKLLQDGWTTVADVDNDGFPEVLVICSEFNSFNVSDTDVLWIFNHDGTL